MQHSQGKKHNALKHNRRQSFQHITCSHQEPGNHKHRSPTFTDGKCKSKHEPHINQAAVENINQAQQRIVNEDATICKKKQRRQNSRFSAGVLACNAINEVAEEKKRHNHR